MEWLNKICLVQKFLRLENSVIFFQVKVKNRNGYEGNKQSVNRYFDVNKSFKTLRNNLQKEILLVLLLKSLVANLSNVLNVSKRKVLKIKLTLKLVFFLIDQGIIINCFTRQNREKYEQNNINKPLNCKLHHS